MFDDPVAQAIYETVLNRPKDDAPRLILADRLEELGMDARAEFIRLQIRMASFLDNLVTGRTDPTVFAALFENLPESKREHTAKVFLQGNQNWKALERREQELLDTAAVEDWARMPASVCNTWRFRRGFVDEIELKVWDFAGGQCPTCQGAVVETDWESLRCVTCGGSGAKEGGGAADWLFKLHPITKVKLTDAHPDGNEGRYWHCQTEYTWPSPYHLPGDLFDQIPAACEYIDSDMCIPFKRFKTYADAMAALSDGAVALGRIRCGIDEPSTNPE